MAARIVVALDRNDTVIVAQAEEAENQDMLKEVVDGSAPLVRLAATLSNMNRQWQSTNTTKVAKASGYRAIESYCLPDIC